MECALLAHGNWLREQLLKPVPGLRILQGRAFARHIPSMSTFVSHMKMDARGNPIGNDGADVGADRPSRKPIILIGAPSGAGKTVLSQQIIAGGVPILSELCAGAPDGAPLRYDLKVLPDNPPRDRVVIIECATHQLERLSRTEPWRRMLALVRESEQVICINLDVPRGTLVRQYLVRIFTLPKRMHVIKRVVQLQKYRNTLIYMLTGRLARANAAWGRFGQELAAEMPPRVAIASVRRSGRVYCVDKAPSHNS